MVSLEEDYESANPIDYYDIIISVDSLMNLEKGWERKCTPAGLQRYEEKKDKRSCVVGIVGNGNKGKSFILQNLVGGKFPSGFSVRTEGLSIKYPTFLEKNIILLDSAGLETPLTDSEDFQLTEDTDEIKAYEEIQLIARDKQLTELFLQKFVMSQSDILIAVVGQLTYSDQKLLNRIKKDNLNQKSKLKMLYVIHNLMNFNMKSQVENYMEDTLNHSLTFKLRENRIVDFNVKEGQNPNEKQNQLYYTEIVKDKSGVSQSIVHLIMARKGTEAGDYYNESTLNFLRSASANYTNIEKFPILDKIKEHLANMSKDLIENPIMKEDIILGDKTIKINQIRGPEGEENYSGKIQLRRCFVDELGFSNFLNNGFTPFYRYYTKENYLIIEIEISGKINNFKTKVITLQDYYLFKLTGEKEIEDVDSTKSNAFFSSRDCGKFVLDIRILLTDINLKEKKLAKSDKQEGVIILYYNIDTSKDDDGEEVKFN